MTALNFTFNAEEVTPAGSFEPIPAGDYVAQITESEMKDTKVGDGKYLSLTLEVLEGEFKGRKLFDRLNLENPNQQTVEIARRTLSAICHATGVLRLSDSEQLHFKPMLVGVRVRPAGPDKQGVERDAANEIRRYSRPDAAATGGFVPKAASASAPAWGRA